MTIENQGPSSQQVNLSFVSQFKTDEIYKKNAFRLLQIPTTSTDRDITRRKQILEISQKTQAPIPDGPCKIFPIDLNENHLDINSLVDSLRDPVRRFYQEFFWFWPISTEKNHPDLALQALSNGLTDEARNIWAGNHSDPREYAISLHNLAVLNHFIALNNDYLIEQKGSPDWQEVYKKWGDLKVLTDFWSILQEKIREVNDPRLAHDLVINLRLSALSIIAYTNAQEAVRLAEKGNLDDAKNLISQIQNNSLDIPVNEILKLAVSDNRGRILTIASLVKQKAKSDPAHCDAAIETLLKESNKQLQIIKAISIKETNEFRTLRNEIVEIALNAVESYMDTTDDWQQSIDLIKSVELLPTTKKNEEKAKSLLELYTEFGKNQNYWHCPGYYDDGIPRELFEKLEKARESFTHQDYEESITLLEALIVSYNSDPILAKKAIHPPLAFTLSRQANDLVRKGISTVDTPRTMINRIFENIRNKDQKCLVSLLAVKNNSIQDYSRRNMLYCSSCLSTIYGTFYTGETDGLKYIICERCYQSDRAELDSVRKRALNFFIQAKELLTRANSIQPSNLVVSSGLSTVYDILEKLYKIPRPKTKQEDSVLTNSLPSKVPPPSPLYGNNEPKQKMGDGTKALIIIGIIAAVIACILIAGNGLNSAPAYSTSTASPTFRPTTTSTRTPTKRPTSVPVIVPTSTCRNWSSIKATDAGKYVCATGDIYDAYWGSDYKVFYMTFSDKPKTLRLEILGGYYFDNIVNDCIIAEGVVYVVDGVPIIQIEPGSGGEAGNLYGCD